MGITALPFILLRLVDDFRPQPMWLMTSASVLFAAVAFLGFVAPRPLEPAYALVPVAYVVVLGGYASVAFFREGRSTAGVTRRRMQAVALGSALLATVLLLAGVSLLLPALDDGIGIVTQAISLAIVLAYFVGFAPPAMLRRAWQEPAIRALLAEAADLVQLPDAHAVAERIEARAMAATGADGAAVGLWDDASESLVIRQPAGDTVMRPGEYIAGRAFEQQQTLFTARAERDAPEHAEQYRASGVHAIAAAPVTSGDRRLGVLVVYAARPPAFTDDVLSLIDIIAEQAALVLRSQQLLQEAAAVRAMAEVTRLKDDFLSVVAHDVRTPLTTILINAELLERSLGADTRDGRRAASLRTEGQRLKQLVEDYLDVVRAEHGRPSRREPHDLSALVREAVSGMGPSASRVKVTARGPVEGSFDAPRVTQLVQNLVSNGLKYSDGHAAVEVAVGTDDTHGLITVTDRGIGIPEADLALLFERFHRGSNTDDRRYAGLGLGLYICRQIAREHDGDIDVTSQVGRGTTFTARLSLVATGSPTGQEAA